MRTLQGKMFLAFSLIICLAILPISYITYSNYSKVIEKNAISYISDRIRGADENLRAIVEEADKISRVIISRDIVLSGVKSDLVPPSYEWFQEKKQVEEFLVTMSAYKTYVHRIAIISTKANVFQTGPTWTSASEAMALFKEKSLDGNWRHLIFDASEGTIMLVRPITENGQTLGLCVIQFNPGFVQRVFEIEPLEGSVIGVIDEAGQIIYHNRADWIQKQALETNLADWWYADQTTELKSQVRLIDGRPHLTVRFASDYTGWTTVGMVPMDVLLSEVHHIRNQILTITLIVLGAVLLISIILSNQITKNIKRLRNTMKLVREGNLQARPRIKTKDEIGQLSAMFSSMMTHLQDLMQETRIREQQKREAEYRALQSQINPHFLYNTLNTIKYLARIQNVHNIEEISESLVEIMRFAVDQSRNMISIREELAQINRYLSIQKYKYLDRIKVIIDSEEDVLDCLIPKLILQPVVENALIHGFGTSLEAEGTVTIRIYGAAPGLVVLDVTDSGIGMSEAAIRRITEEEPQIGCGTGSIGLRNVNERIKLTFGEEFGITIYSQNGVFTTVELRLPQERGPIT